MISQLFDNLISLVSPSWALSRAAARISLQQMAAYAGSTNSGYKASKLNRLTKNWAAAARDENSQPRSDISRLRANSWELWRNNSHAKKICRSIESKVVGRGMTPLPQAVLPNGQPHLEFRKRAKQLWQDMRSHLDYRGRPGSGGQEFSDLARTALRATILGGEVFYRFRQGDPPAPKLPGLKLQLIHAERLAESPGVDIPTVTSKTFFYGIELDRNDRRKFYHFYKYHPTDPRSAASQEVIRVPASQVGHLFVGEDVDQLRGTPWFSAALIEMRDTSDYKYNELKAAAVSACVVLGYRRSSGQSQFALNQPDDWDLEDADGNKLTAMQPGMLLDLGRNGEIQGFNPQRPNSNAADFIAHMLRSQAVSVPGVKGSTLTGDYRNSSFSSEKAADNDAWPEIENVQDWMAWSFYQPIYEQLLISAVIEGYFQDIVDTEDFTQRKQQYLKADWQGPIARSINPLDDAKSSKERVRNGQSSPQREAALIGADWQEIVKEVAEYVEFCDEQEIPKSVVLQTLGIEQQDDPLDLEEEGTNTEGEGIDASKGVQDKGEDGD